MNNLLKEYFSFSRKERTGIFVLLALIMATIAFPYFFPDVPVQVDKTALARLKQQVAASPATISDAAGNKGYYSSNSERDAEGAGKEVVLFVFDPNTLPVEDWGRLGVQERTAITIQHYLEKGGRFRKPDDLYKVYGLKKEVADRLIPYVRIKGVDTMVKPRPADLVRDEKPKWKNYPGSFVKPAIININTADTTAFIALRGIGSKLAQRIILFREKLGGFHSVEQVGETYGLPDSTFQQIRVWLQCPTPVLRTININVADAALLQQHPYIRWAEANAIVQFRGQHGTYRSVDELLQINIISSALLEKVRPYLAIE